MAVCTGNPMMGECGPNGPCAKSAEEVKQEADKACKPKKKEDKACKPKKKGKK